MSINIKAIEERAFEISDSYDISYSVARAILLSGYSLCQDDLISSKDLNTNKIL
jgi:hypothetical protein